MGLYPRGFRTGCEAGLVRFSGCLMGNLCYTDIYLSDRIYADVLSLRSLCTVLRGLGNIVMYLSTSLTIPICFKQLPRHTTPHLQQDFTHLVTKYIHVTRRKTTSQFPISNNI